MLEQSLSDSITINLADLTQQFMIELPSITTSPVTV